MARWTIVATLALCARVAAQDEGPSNGHVVGADARAAPLRIAFEPGPVFERPDGVMLLAVAFGDVDGDGDVDRLTIERHRHHSEFALHENDGRGVFSRRAHPTPPAPADRIDGIDLADVDGDGDADVLTWRLGDDGEIALLLTEADGSLSAVEVTGWSDRPIESGQVGFTNTDPPRVSIVGRRDDLLELHSVPKGARATVVETMRVPGGLRDRVADVASSAWADFDGDGHPDVATAKLYLGAATLRVLRGHADGALTDVSDAIVPADVLGYEASDCAWTDIDGDGRLDLVVANYGNPFASGEPDVVLVQRADGTFRRVDVVGAPRQQTLGCAVADMDADGDVDLLFTGAVSSYDYVVENRGDRFVGRRFDGSPGLPRPLASPEELADVDGDGDIDIATHDRVYLNTARSR